MRASKFRKFKGTFPKEIKFFFEVKGFEDEWEEVTCHPASGILGWIIKRSGATLRKNQIIEAWGSTVSALSKAKLTRGWRSIVDNHCDTRTPLAIGESDVSRILWEINHWVEREPHSTAKMRRAKRRHGRNSNPNFWDEEGLLPEFEFVSGPGGYRRVARVATA